MAAPILHHESRRARMSWMEEKMFRKVTLPSAKDVCSINSHRFLITFICIWILVRNVPFQNGGLHDRGIIFRDENNVSLTAEDMDYNNSSRRFRPLVQDSWPYPWNDSLALRSESREEWISLMRLTTCQYYIRMVRVREKVFRKSSGFRFNVSFLSCTSVFVESVLQASPSFTHILQITTVTLNHVDHVCNVTSNVSPVPCNRRPPLWFDYEVYEGRKNWKTHELELLKDCLNLICFQPLTALTGKETWGKNRFILF